MTNVSKVCGIAINRLKLTPKEYWKLTPAEFYNALLDYEEQHHTQGRYQLISARYICATIWNAAGKKLRHPIRNLEDFMPMPWERQEQAKRKQTPDEMHEILMQIAGQQNRKYAKK